MMTTHATVYLRPNRGMTRPVITIGVQPGTKLLRIERIESRAVPMDWGYEYIEGTGAWMVWINANPTFTAGTHLLLHDNGRVERVTVHPDGMEDVFVVKEGDKT